MQVILVKPVKNLGRIGELVKVKNGFGRNYLIPQQVAIRATEFNKQLMEEQKGDFETKNAEVKTSAEAVASEINNKTLVFIKQSSEDGRLFGSVTAKEIAAELSKIAKSEVSHSSIILNTPIKTLGKFDINVTLHAEVTANISLVIARSESEAQEALNQASVASEYTPDDSGKNS